MERTEGVVDVDDFSEAPHEKFHYRIDREKAGMSGVTAAEAAQTLQAALGGAPVGVASLIWPHGRWRLDLHGRLRQQQLHLCPAERFRRHRDSGRLDDAVNNPQSFVDYAAEHINAVKRELLVHGVEYFKVDALIYEMRRFDGDDLMEVFASNVRAVEKQDKTIFSHIVIDSNSSPERTFAQACDDNEDVLFYIKLPRWFQIETPVGPYNPDWAVAYRNDKTLYFVAETKKTGSGDHVRLDLLRPIEELRIECGKRHFKNFEEVQFKVVSSLEELVN